jgi:hypothetical protein
MESLRQFLFLVYTDNTYQKIAAGVGFFLLVWGFLWVVRRAFAYRWYVGIFVLFFPLLLTGAAIFFGLIFSIDPRLLVACSVVVLVLFPAIYAIRTGLPTAIPLILMLLGMVILAAPGPLDYAGWLKDTRPRIIEIDGRPTLTLTGATTDYSELERMPNLILLQMANREVTDEIVAKVAGLKELKELDLDSTQVTDAGLAALTKLPLQVLRLEHTKVTTSGFQTHLAPIETLKTVYLRGTEVDYDVAKKWQKEKDGRRAIIDRPKKGTPP